MQANNSQHPAIKNKTCKELGINCSVLFSSHTMYASASWLSVTAWCASFHFWPDILPHNPSSLSPSHSILHFFKHLKLPRAPLCRKYLHCAAAGEHRGAEHRAIRVWCPFLLHLLVCTMAILQKVQYLRKVLQCLPKCTESCSLSWKYSKTH